MRLINVLKGGLSVALVSVFYNLVIFSLLKTFPEFSFGVEIFNLNIFVIIFLKNFAVGIILMVLFSYAYKNIIQDTGEPKYTIRAIIFFVLYGVFALVSFTFGDMLMMRTSEGLLLVLTLDGIVESALATIPIKIFTAKDIK